ncbi:bifunctional phosphoribosylaminoimidazolecarboxamide formyltransferase/IMP cyclohydrolase [Candidatus Roizmanbacteria bacterium]|nr:bifunctional phosphoribosylaminoimidazolecarboxamide formyltransferase/IMP cyclohydrolase [Candidatus Roizmanbacteria bacterium]
MKNQSYALISVFDKKGLVELAQKLRKKNIKIISTGGTAKELQQHNIEIIPIEQITNSPESFEGRMKTISFEIASGILFDRKKESHQKEAANLNIPHIDYVICNFYDFWKQPGIEMIDVGGPTMVRAAAKNFENVVVLTDPNDYQTVIKQLEKNSTVDEIFRKNLAAKAFSYVAEYDNLIANYFQDQTDGIDKFISLQKGTKLRYGENPHQEGIFFRDQNSEDKLGLGTFKIVQGKETSYNNYLDLDAGLQTISLIGNDKPACVILKHTNPCGAAVADTITDAFQKAWYGGDPLAAFGGVIFVNRTVTEELAMQMLADKKFFEILAAPSFTKEALKVFTQKPKLQLLENKNLEKPFLTAYKEIKKIRGGVLMQDTDIKKLTDENLKSVTNKKPTNKQLEDLIFAWKIAQVSKSNCVIAARDGVLLASGVGQQDRKRCCELCVSKANTSLKGAVAATDGFFPFRDGPDILIKAGISAIIQPGGSIRDQETIDACNENDVTMIMTGVRIFKH